MTEDQAVELIQLLTEKFGYVSFMLEALFYALCFVEFYHEICFYTTAVFTLC